MAIETFAGGGMVITGEHINVYRILALKAALKLEIKGLKRSRGPSAYKVIKNEFGFTGSKEKVLEQLEEVIAAGLIK